MKAHGLEQRAHLRLTGQAIKLSCDLLGAIGASQSQRLGAGFDAEGGQELALSDDGAGFRAGFPRGGDDRGKVGPDGEVGLAGGLQRVDLLVALDGPEADEADTMTVRAKVGDVSLTLELRADPVDGTGDTDNG